MQCLRVMDMAMPAAASTFRWGSGETVGITSCGHACCTLHWDSAPFCGLLVVPARTQVVLHTEHRDNCLEALQACQGPASAQQSPAAAGKVDCGGSRYGSTIFQRPEARDRLKPAGGPALRMPIASERGLCVAEAHHPTASGSAISKPASVSCGRSRSSTSSQS